MRGELQQKFCHASCKIIWMVHIGCENYLKNKKNVLLSLVVNIGICARRLPFLIEIFVCDALKLFICIVFSTFSQGLQYAQIGTPRYSTWSGREMIGVRAGRMCQSKNRSKNSFSHFRVPYSVIHSVWFNVSPPLAHPPHHQPTIEHERYQVGSALKRLRIFSKGPRSLQFNTAKGNWRYLSIEVYLAAVLS